MQKRTADQHSPGINRLAATDLAPEKPVARNTALLPLGAMLMGVLLGPQSAYAEDEQTLPTVTVQDDRASESKGLQGGTTRVGKLVQLPKDVPQALTIISEQLIEDKNAHTLKEALGNVAGLTFNAGEGGRIGDNMNLRGFYSFGDMYLDGIRDVAQYNRETFNLEQIDVLRGSGSMLFGRGQAGGVINQVSKEAGMFNGGSVTATYGSDDYKRVTADVNGMIGDSAALRINAMKTDAGSSRDNVQSKREGIAPTLRWIIDTGDELTLSHYYLKTHNTPDYGVPFFQQRPLDVPASRFYGTTADYEDNTTHISTLGYKHSFSGDTELKTVLRRASYTRDLWAVQPQLRNVGCAAGTVTSVSDANCINRSVKARGGEENTLTSQTDFSSKFNTAGLRHEALVGLELLKEKASRWSYSTTGITVPTTTVGATDASASGLGSLYGHQNRSNINTYTGNSWGIYAQDSIEFTPGWKVLVGLRRDNLSADYASATGTNALKFAETSYRSGLMYQPDDTQSYYLAWNDSFNPTADLYQLDDGRAFDPERSQTIELGAKWELFEGNLSLRAAIYRAEKEWERNTDVETSGGILSKKRRTDGIELEAAGRITRQWEVFGGVALMHSEILEPGYNINATTGVITAHNANLKGMRPRNTPRYTANLWTTYKLDGGWKLGIGADLKGDRLAYGIGPGTTAIVANEVPAYIRWDALIAYEQKAYNLKLNVMNLLNKRYYESVYDNGGHVVAGTERAVQLTAELKL